MAHPHLTLCAGRRSLFQLSTRSTRSIVGHSRPWLSSSSSLFLCRSPQPRALSTSAVAMAPIPSTMKAIQIVANGGPEVVKENTVPVPQLGEGQLLVRNTFAGVNFIDTYFRSGLYKSPYFPLTLGREGAGEVVAAHASVGEGAFPVGTRVVFMPGVESGTYAQFTAVPADKAIVIPDGISDDVAVAAFLQGLTAWTLIRDAAEVKPGQWTLVHAAAGGVGLHLVQMLRAVGAKVIGTASTDAKCSLARENGAEWTVNSSTDIVAQVKEITGGHGVDVIFDGVGKATFEADLEMAALRGKLVSFGNASGAVEPFSILRLGAKNLSVMRPVLFGYVGTRAELEKNSKELFEMISQGKLQVAIHKVYPLSDVAQAHADLEGRKSTGKLVIKCN